MEELKGLINTLASEIDETTIQKYQVLANQYFYDRGNKNCLYYKEKIEERINENYKSELKLLPSGENLKRKNQLWYISRPQFIEKNRTKISWSSRVEVLCEIYKEETTPSIFDNNSNSNLGLLTSGLLSNQRIIPSTKGLLSETTQPIEGYLSGLTSKKIICKGKTIFAVSWSVNIDINNKLTRPVINDIKFIDTLWED